MLQIAQTGEKHKKTFKYTFRKDNTAFGLVMGEPQDREVRFKSHVILVHGFKKSQILQRMDYDETE